jgi:dihydroorotate dehydrogenase (fumarate)
MNLKTKYLGLDLRTPLVASSSPLTREIDNVRKLEDAGISAIVLHSLFEEQTAACRANYEFGSLIGPEAYMDHLFAAKSEVGIPLIASLNCTSLEGWHDFTRQIEEAGADAVEVNIYSVPADPGMTSASIENHCLEIVTAVREATALPLAIKLSPYFTNFGGLALRIAERGAEALVLFNRFYQYDIDIEMRAFTAGLLPSTEMDMRLSLHWISHLFGTLELDLAATSGIWSGTDVIKMSMAGADVTMLCSVLLQKGVGHIPIIESEMVGWMEEHGVDSLDQIRGEMSLRNCSDPSALERSQYFRALSTSEPPFVTQN